MTREEFIGLVSVEQEPLRRFLLALCGDPTEADDIAQDALVNAYVASGSFRGRSSFGTWLFRIAYNCFIDRTRSHNLRTEPLDGATWVLAAEELTDSNFCHETLHRAIHLLPEKERAAILLFYMEDRSVKEIAAILDIPAGSVRAYLTRGRLHLKTLLEKWKTK